MFLLADITLLLQLNEAGVIDTVNRKITKCQVLNALKEI